MSKLFLTLMSFLYGVVKGFPQLIIAFSCLTKSSISPVLHWLTLKCVHYNAYLIALYTLTTTTCIFFILDYMHVLRCWFGKFLEQSRASSVDDHCLYSHDNVWLKSDIVRRNKMLVTLKDQMVDSSFFGCIEGVSFFNNFKREINDFHHESWLSIVS